MRWVEVGTWNHPPTILRYVSTAGGLLMSWYDRGLSCKAQGLLPLLPSRHLWCHPDSCGGNAALAVLGCLAVVVLPSVALVSNFSDFCDLEFTQEQMGPLLVFVAYQAGHVPAITSLLLSRAAGAGLLRLPTSQEEFEHLGLCKAANLVAWAESQIRQSVPIVIAGYCWLPGG